MLVQIIAKDDLHESVKGAVADYIFSFISCHEHVILSHKWFQKGAVYHPSNPNKDLIKLSDSHKRQIIKQIYKNEESGEVTKQFKTDLLNNFLGDDKSDISQNLRFYCQATSADPKTKEQVWKDLVDPKTKLSFYERRAQMQGFYCQGQIDLLRPYFDKFYEVLPTFSEEHGMAYVKSFMKSMLPRMEIQDRHII